MERSTAKWTEQRIWVCTAYQQLVHQLLMATTSCLVEDRKLPQGSMNLTSAPAWIKRLATST